MSVSYLSRLNARSAPVYHVIDAQDEVIGRLAPQIAKLLTGKHKPTYVPHSDCGDFVVVINAGSAKFTGTKEKNKLYRWHTGFPGGLKSLTAAQMRERHPDKLVTSAVSGMLPKSTMRKSTWLKRLRVFSDDVHPYSAQVAASARAAPQYVQYCKPQSKRIHVERQPVEGREDYYFGKPAPESEPASSTLPATDDAALDALWRAQLALTVQAEAVHWAQQGEPRIPDASLRLHGLKAEHTSAGWVYNFEDGSELPDVEQAEITVAKAQEGSLGTLPAMAERE